MTAVRRLCCLFGILLGVGLVTLAGVGAASSMPGQQEPTLGILVGSAGRSIGISIGSAGGDSTQESDIIGGRARSISVDPDNGSWIAVITTDDGDLQVEASSVDAGGRHMFTYEITNLSVDGGDAGIAIQSLAVPLAGDVRPGDIEASTGWQDEASLGTLGGFLLFRSDEHGGVPVGESVTVRFSLPTLPPPGDPVGSADAPSPPGLFLGVDFEASTNTLLLTEHPMLATPPPQLPASDWSSLCPEGSPGYFELSDGRAVCIRGATAVGPDSGTQLRLELLSLASEGEDSAGLHDSSADDILVALPVCPGQMMGRGPSVPEGWIFESPRRPIPGAGFAVFVGDPWLEPEDSSPVLLSSESRPFFSADAEISMDWTTGTCIVDVAVSPDIAGIPFELDVDHRWCCTGDCDASSNAESDTFSETTDADGQLRWSFHVFVHCPDGYEFLRLNLDQLSVGGYHYTVAVESFEISP